jgi:hypothetical protein
VIFKIALRVEKILLILMGRVSVWLQKYITSKIRLVTIAQIFMDKIIASFSVK